MANNKQLKLLESGVDEWNRWRLNNPNTKIDLSSADLRSKDLSYANLKSANLCKANLMGSRLQGTHLVESSLIFADISHANLKEANLSQAILIGANFSYSNLCQAKLKRAKGSLREGFLYWIVAYNFNINDLFSRGLFLSLKYWNNISRINFKSARLDGADLSETLFNNAEFDQASLRQCNFSDACLRNASFRKANLEHANLHSALLKNVNLEHSKCSMVKCGLSVRWIFAFTLVSFSSSFFTINFINFVAKIFEAFHPDPFRAGLYFFFCVAVLPAIIYLPLELSRSSKSSGKISIFLELMASEVQEKVIHFRSLFLNNFQVQQLKTNVAKAESKLFRIASTWLFILFLPVLVIDLVNHPFLLAFLLFWNLYIFSGLESDLYLSINIISFYSFLVIFILVSTRVLQHSPIEMAGAKIITQIAGTNLTKANLSYSDFCFSNLRFSNLSRISLSATNLYGVSNALYAFSEHPHLQDHRKSLDNDKKFPKELITQYDLIAKDLRTAQEVSEIEWRFELYWKQQALKGTYRYSCQELNLVAVYISSVSTYKPYKISIADLRYSNFRNSDLTKSVLREANLTGANLAGANLSFVDLTGANLRDANLSFANLTGANLVGVDLSRSKVDSAVFAKADLSHANLQGLELIGIDFSDANFLGADLKYVRAISTNFKGANLTGVCIENWLVGSRVNFDEVTCRYMYLKDDLSERRPRSDYFNSGDFASLQSQIPETIDLIFQNEIDWGAFFQSFQKLRVKYPNENIALQKIEQKENAFVVNLKVDTKASKATLEQEFYRKYDIDKRLLEEHYLAQLTAQGTELEEAKQRVESTRREMATLVGTLKFMPNIQNAQIQNAQFIYGGSGTQINNPNSPIVQGATEVNFWEITEDSD